jgi:hypothetical protein
MKVQRSQKVIGAKLKDIQGGLLAFSVFFLLFPCTIDRGEQRRYADSRLFCLHLTSTYLCSRQFNSFSWFVFLYLDYLLYI